MRESCGSESKAWGGCCSAVVYGMGQVRSAFRLHSENPGPKISIHNSFFLHVMSGVVLSCLTLRRA